MSEVTYDRAGRMQYHPDFHPNHGKPWTQEDLEYLCMFYEIDDSESMAMALGKTTSVIRLRYHNLKKRGLVERYRKKYLKKLED